MIRYTVKCRNGHSFESWFQSAGAFDSLLATGMVVCPDCGEKDVTKSLMAPSVRPARAKAAVPDNANPAMTNAPDPKLVEAIREFREHVEKNSEYVGDSFATEARAMHEGDMDYRAIYGEVNAKEARKLIEDGVPAMPLPFVPRQKTN